MAENTGPNQAPHLVGADVILHGQEDTPLHISASELLAFFVDPDGDPMTVTFEPGLDVTANADRSFDIALPRDFNGSTFTTALGTVSDGRGGSVQFQPQLEIAAVNDAPRLLDSAPGALALFGPLTTSSVVVDAQGRIVVLGTSFNTELPDLPSWQLMRLLPDGRRDLGFGDHGVVALQHGDLTLVDGHLRLQADGSAVIGGSYTSRGDGSTGFIAMRVLADGTIDAGFDQGQGAFLRDMGSGEVERAEFVDAQGRILLTGWSKPDDAQVYTTQVLRLDADGRPDPSFGTGGLARWSMDALGDRADGFAQQSDGKLLVVGRAGDGIGTRMAVTRLLDDGERDAGFGGSGSGSVLLAAPDYDVTRGREVAVLPDGKLLAAGFAFHRATADALDVVMCRLNADGTLDTSFATGGWAIAALGHVQAVPLHILAWPQDRITLVIDSSLPSGEQGQTVLARFMPDGSPDAAFGSTGTVSVAGLVGGGATVPAFDAQGHLLVGAGLALDGGAATGIAWVNVDGTLDAAATHAVPAPTLRAAQLWSIDAATLLRGWSDPDAGDLMNVDSVRFAAANLTPDLHGDYALTAPAQPGRATLEYAIGDLHGASTAATLGLTITTFAGVIDGSAGADTLAGSGIGEHIAGFGGNDSLAGGDGDDLLVGGAGSDRLDGGDGFDIASYDDAMNAGIDAVAVHADLAAGTATQGTDVDTLIGIEAIFGSSLADTLRGADGAATQRGETLRGGGGDDTIDGGTGVDTAEWLGRRSDYTITQIDVTTWTVRDDNTVNGDEGTDTVTNIERFQFADSMLAFGTRAEELARVAAVLWSPAIFSQPAFGALFSRGFSFYDVGHDFDVLSQVALQLWTDKSDAQLAQQLAANSGTSKSAAQLLATLDTAGGGDFGRAAMVREAANDPATLAALDHAGVKLTGISADNVVNDFGTLHALLPGG